LIILRQYLLSLPACRPDKTALRFNNPQINLKLLVKYKSLVFEQLVAVCATGGAVIVVKDNLILCHFLLQKLVSWAKRTVIILLSMHFYICTRNFNTNFASPLCKLQSYFISFTVSNVEKGHACMFLFLDLTKFSHANITLYLFINHCLHIMLGANGRLKEDIVLSYWWHSWYNIHCIVWVSYSSTYTDSNNILNFITLCFVVCTAGMQFCT